MKTTFPSNVFAFSLAKSIICCVLPLPFGPTNKFTIALSPLCIFRSVLILIIIQQTEKMSNKLSKKYKNNTFNLCKLMYNTSGMNELGGKTR